MIASHFCQQMISLNNAYKDICWSTFCTINLPSAPLPLILATRSRNRRSAPSTHPILLLHDIPFSFGMIFSCQTCLEWWSFYLNAEHVSMRKSNRWWPRSACNIVCRKLRLLKPKTSLSAQSKLNCEVLSPELGLQLRWSLAGSSIILQIVANLGEIL